MVKYILIYALILIGVSPAFGGTPTITNIRDVTFTISWTTPVSEKGWVEYGTSSSLGMSAYDERGQATVDDTHYVPINELSGTTTYYYQVVSGGVKSRLATITTAGAINPSQTGKIAYGRVYFQGTTIPAKGAIVYANIKTNSETTSDTQSIIVVKEDGTWSIPLDNFRSLDGYSQFQHSLGDTMVVKVIAAGDGIAEATATIATTTDMGTITLTGDTIAPPDISAVNPTPKDGRILLSWNMPDISSGALGVLILRGQQGYPATPTTGVSYGVGSSTSDGTVVYVSTSTDTTTWTDETLTNDTTYYYRMFIHDGAYNYSQGISCRATPEITLDNVRVYPNPLIGDGGVYFDKLLANTSIYIYNMAGELVLEADAPYGTYSWLPKDIASGIYLYLLKSDNGDIQTGKIGIVR